MTMASEERVNPLNPLLSSISRYEQADFQQQSREAKLVDWTLNRLNLKEQKKAIMADAEGRSLTFSMFHEHVDLPIRLGFDALAGVIPLHRDQKAVLPNWYKHFLNLSFVKAYDQAFEGLRVKNETPFGLIFPRKGFAQGMIVHNGDMEKFVPPRTSCHFYRGGSKYKMNLVVQPYVVLVDQLRDGHFRGDNNEDEIEE